MATDNRSIHPLVVSSSIHRTLYGIRVPADQYVRLKEITDALVGQSDHREYINDARRRCVLIALDAMGKSQTASRAEATKETSTTGEPTPASFLRGSRLFQPTNHIVTVVSRDKVTRHLRRVALTLAQIAELKAVLFDRVAAGDIASFEIDAAEDVTASQVIEWAASFAKDAQQSNLLDISQNPMCGGDVA